MPPPVFKHYAQRLLNPYQGTVQIVESQAARAVSTDGLHWRIQIRSDIYKIPWTSLAVPAPQQRYFVYGLWSRRAGLARLPVHPSLYQEHVEQSVKDLLTQLQQLQHAIPFALHDKYELWLFDSRRERAIALLASCLTREEIALRKHVEWYSLGRGDTTFGSDTGSHSAAERLQHAVRQCCSQPPTAYWIARREDASGTILHDHRGRTKHRDKTLGAEHFPVCLLTDDWHDPDTHCLVADYHAWQAPLLLMLPLPEARRRELEQLAARRPAQVYRYHRLYPQCGDQDLLKKVLVEAVMRQAEAEREQDTLP